MAEENNPQQAEAPEAAPAADKPETAKAAKPAKAPKADKAYTPRLKQDYEDRIHLAVTLEDDPGRDLGIARQPGHLFFFSPDEVEPLAQ